jgi:hypothetical protein
MTETVKYTKTASFLFPLLEVPKALFLCNVTNTFGKVLFTNRFINAYLIDENLNKYPKEEGYIKVLVNNYQDIGFQAFYDTLCSFSAYVEDYTIYDNLIFIFKVSDRYMEDFNLLTQVGAGYSQISKDAQKLILANHFFTGTSATIPLILHKSFVLKESWEERLNADIGDQEVWGMIVDDKETLTREYLKEISVSKTKVIGDI